MTKDAVMVVQWSSGTRYCDASLEVQADHFSIVEPESAEHLSVITVTKALKELLFNPALKPRLERPDFGADGEPLAFRVSGQNIRAPARVDNTGGCPLTFSLTEPTDPDRLVLWPHRPYSGSRAQSGSLSIDGPSPLFFSRTRSASARGDIGSSGVLIPQLSSERIAW